MLETATIEGDAWGTITDLSRSDIALWFDLSVLIFELSLTLLSLQQVVTDLDSPGFFAIFASEAIEVCESDILSRPI
jgi:hypothetical protein